MAKKDKFPLQGFHFPSDGVRPAAYIEAATIEEAEALFLKQSTPSEKPVAETDVQ
jgi:hypothetical protein